MIISSLERPRSRPVLEQENREVFRIGSYFGIEFGHRDVSDFDLLPSLFLIRLEYFVERLIKGSSLVRHHYRDVEEFPVLDVTLLSPVMLKARFFSCSGGRCVNT